ncbi:hypothetical protein ABLB84_01060 [Xenorhabdus szentirmaii]|uniref:hypothetical protein n=1 Tax=Xenorhabdus szentirmaii TaxID=290112 RepID=UPI0032B7ED20
MKTINKLLEVMMRTIKFTNTSNIKITVTLKEKNHTETYKKDIYPQSSVLFETQRNEYHIEYCNIFMSIDKYLIDQTFTSTSSLSYLEEIFYSSHEFEIYFDVFSYGILLVSVDKEG